MKLSNFEYDTGSGEIISICYISPFDLFEYLVKNHPAVLVGGIESACERSKHLECFWSAYYLQRPDHWVFESEEHKHNLDTVFPLFWHGDEGRGPDSCSCPKETCALYRASTFACTATSVWNCNQKANAGTT